MPEIALRPIQAAVTRAKGAPFSIESAYLREPRKDEILVRVVAAGLCHTDLIVRDQLYPVPLPAVLGHEGSGLVEAIGPEVRDFAIGDPVVLSFGSCGDCLPCREGHASYCAHFYDLNFGGCDCHGQHAITDSRGAPLNDHFFSQSSFATYALTRAGDAVKVAKEAPIELLGPPGCGIQTGAGAVINSLAVRPGSSFATFGTGGVGLSAVMAARACGATTIIAVDVIPSRLQLALEVGATHVINSRQSDPVAAIREITRGGVDHALESTGIPAVFSQGVDSLGVLGELGVVGASQLGTRVDFDINSILITGKRIKGICEGDSVPKKFIPQLVELYLQGRFPMDRLVKYYPFAKINQAAQDSEKGLTLKPILLMP